MNNIIIQTEDDIKELVESDEWMMQVLVAAESLNLPDWWIGAGFLRNKVWNAVTGNDCHSNSDVDLVYFNQDKTLPETDWSYDAYMNQKFPFAEWEIRNQARMHYKSNLEPFTSTAEGISHWIETATCIAVKIENRQLKFLFCYGIDDLVGMVIRPIPQFKDPSMIHIFHNRVQSKNWSETWPNLKIQF
jgi:hypothetical protein